jgi:hypothetical protein
LDEVASGASSEWRSRENLCRHNAYRQRRWCIREQLLATALSHQGAVAFGRANQWRKRRAHVIHLHALAGGNSQGVECDAAVDVPRLT